MATSSGTSLSSSHQKTDDHFNSVLLGLGFEEWIVTLGVYVHKKREVQMAIHVDDLIATGKDRELRWLSKELQRLFEMKVDFLGPEKECSQEVAYLGRLIRWTSDGVTIEGDRKHVDNLLKLLGMKECNTVSTPMIASEGGKSEEDDNELLDAVNAKKYRGGTALILYMSQDRCDLTAAACHLARRMASPGRRDVERLKRVARYLKGAPHVELLMAWQDPASDLKLYTDSDWANCKTTRKSHSGGALFVGQHLVSHWCRIQPTIALSSGEAEVYSSCKGLSNSIGVWNTLRELNGPAWGKMTMLVDASVCKAVILRKGAG